MAVSPSAAEPEDRPEADSDRARLRQLGEALQDVHDVRDMLIELGVERLQACRLVGEDFAWRVGCGSFRQALEQAAATALPIMIFVGSPGVVQIHTDRKSTRLNSSH